MTDSVGRDERLNISIGVSQTSATVLLPKLFAQMRSEQLDSVDVTIEMHNSEEILAGVLNHRFDFGMIEKPITHDYILRDEVAVDQLVLAGNLTDQRWLVREKGSGVYHYTQQYFKQNNIVPQHAMTISNNDVIVRMLAQNVGKSIVSIQSLTPDIPYQVLPETFNRSFYMIRLSHENRAEYMKWYNQVVETARQLRD